MNFKIPLTIALFVLVALRATAQTDTTEYLFKKAKYSYLQYHFGYSPMFFSSGQTVHGYSMEFTGVVFNDRIAIGLDFDAFVKSPPYTITSYPSVTSWVALSLSVEPLIRPRKVLNFSFPVKLGYGRGQIAESNAIFGVSVSDPRFFVCNPQAMAWVNLLKSLSLGVGGSYRICMDGSRHTFESFSGASAYATIRFKFYTREYMQKATQRQAEFMKSQPQN